MILTLDPSSSRTGYVVATTIDVYIAAQRQEGGEKTTAKDIRDRDAEHWDSAQSQT